MAGLITAASLTAGGAAASAGRREDVGGVAAHGTKTATKIISTAACALASTARDARVLFSSQGPFSTFHQPFAGVSAIEGGAACASEDVGGVAAHGIKTDLAWTSSGDILPTLCRFLGADSRLWRAGLGVLSVIPGAGWRVDCTFFFCVTLITPQSLRVTYAQSCALVSLFLAARVRGACGRVPPRRCRSLHP